MPRPRLNSTRFDPFPLSHPSAASLVSIVADISETASQTRHSFGARFITLRNQVERAQKQGMSYAAVAGSGPQQSPEEVWKNS